MAAYDLTTEAGVLKYLQQGVFPSSVKATRLADGFCGFVYRIESGPLDDGARSFIVKHVESYAARAPAFKLSQNRLSFEHQALVTLSSLLDQSSPDDCKLPRVLHYDEAAHSLVLEDVGDVPTLKAWYSGSVPTDLCHSVGSSLGRFLARVHKLHLQHPSIIAQFGANDTAKQLSALVYFGNLPMAAARHGFHDDFIAKAAAEGQREVLEAQEVLTIGDFWPGNVLILPTPNEQGSGVRVNFVDLEFCKPGTRAFDVGQMAAEMYCLGKFRDERGYMLLESFLREYKAGAGQVDVAKVAIRFGAHLILMGPAGWREEVDEEKVNGIIADGVQILKAGWEGDIDVLKKSSLEPLLS